MHTLLRVRRDRKGRARAFLMRYTLCNLCIVTETDVHVRSRSQSHEVNE
jgi:hypothetical protein